MAAHRPGDLARKRRQGEAVKDERGQAVPSQRLSTGELVFLARDVPPFGAKRFTIAAGSRLPAARPQRRRHHPGHAIC